MGGAVVLLVGVVGCSSHKKTCERLFEVVGAHDKDMATVTDRARVADEAVASVDAMTVKDADLVPLVARLRSALVAEAAAELAAKAEVTSAMTLLRDGGAAASLDLEALRADATELLDGCFLSTRDGADCRALTSVLDCYTSTPTKRVAELEPCTAMLQSARFESAPRSEAVLKLVPTIRSVVGMLDPNVTVADLAGRAKSLGDRFDAERTASLDVSKATDALRPACAGSAR